MRLFQNNFRGYMTSSHKENELHSSYIPRCQSSVSVRFRRLCATCASAVASSLSWTRSFLTSTSVAIVRNIRLSFGMWLRVDSFPFMYMVASRRKFSSAVVLVFLFTVFALPAFSRPHCDICAFFMHKTRFYLFKVLRRNKNSPCVLAACQRTFSDEE